MKKKILSAVLASVLFITSVISMTSCGNRGKHVTAKIGVLRGDTSSEEALAWAGYLKSLSAEMGVEIDFSTELNSADEELAAVQNYASLGYNGLIVMTSYNPTNIIKNCETYKMFSVIGAAHPDFDDSENALVKDENVIIKDYSDYSYYVGATGPSNYGEVLSGYQMGKAAVSQGYTQYSVFTGSAAYGQPMHALRIAGFFIAMHDDDPTVAYGGIECKRENWKEIALQIEKDLGVNLSSFKSDKYSILAQAGGYSFLQGDTAAVATVVQLSSAAGVEAVFCAGSADKVSSFAPDGTKCVYVGNDSLGATFKTMFEDGKLIFDIAKYNSYIGPAFAMLLKSIYKGEAVRIDGKPISVEQQSLQITSASDYDTLDTVENENGGYFFSSEFLSAYILETELGKNESGAEKLTDSEFAKICALDCTLGEGGLYQATKAITNAYKESGNKVFHFESDSETKG